MSSRQYQLTQISDDTREIAPYFDDDFAASIQRLVKSPTLPDLVKPNFPKLEWNAFVDYISQIRSVDEYQGSVTFVAVKSLVKHSIREFTSSGWNLIDNDRTYLFFSNHRDIICDPSLICWAGRVQGRRTPQICLGDNLLINPLITDLIKGNKGVTVKRKLTQRELLRWSKVLSNYLRRAVEDGVDSVWLAQREGRSKDGFDITHQGVLKMLALSDRHDLHLSFRNLRIVPTAISYEFDPNDVWKALELYKTEKTGSYEKAPGEDLLSMGRGIRGPKGRVHIHIGGELPSTVYESMKDIPRPKAIEQLAEAIDASIALNYRLWPSNWIAHDLVHRSRTGENHYTAAEKNEFQARLEQQLALLPKGDWDRERVKQLTVTAYANTVENFLSHKDR